MSLTDIALYGIAFLILAPLAGGIIAGIDRRITARMQGRIGPPLLQPFYDVGKLFEKETTVVHDTQHFYILCYLVFMVFTGLIFFTGEDILLVIFALTLAEIFIVLGAYAANSPYSFIGAERELIQIMAFEPMIIITAAGMYLAVNSFYVRDILASTTPLILLLPGIFLGLLYTLTIKLRKSPFDISTSHHAHQEIVKGVTTEFSGSTLAMVEIAHWYEIVLLLGIVFLFFAWNPVIGILAIVVIYFLEIFADTTTARVKWHFALKSIWLVAAILGLINLAALYILRGV